MPTTAPYGGWRSPITASLITAQQIGLGSPWLDGGTAYWTESRPMEKGRISLLRRGTDGEAEELTPAPFNLRTRVHEYGGRAFTARDGIVVGSSFADQRLWRLDGGPRPLTPEHGGALRYAEPVLDPVRRRVLAVREDHRGAGEPRNELVAVALEGGDDEGQVLVGGCDFVAYPRPSPDGRRLAWITWDHPDMPWDGTRLWVAGLDEAGRVEGLPVCVAGSREESVLQPEWAADGALWFVSDRSGFWNLWRWADGATSAVCPLEAEIGGALWQLGARWYDLLDAGQAVAVVTTDGLSHLAVLRLGEAAPRAIELPHIELAGVCAAAGAVLVQGQTNNLPGEILRLDPAGGSIEVVARAGDLPVPPSFVSAPQPIRFASQGGREARALYYPPANPEHTARRQERPPLIVRSHGGPTGRASPALNLQVQYWTSRGFAVVDVNYGGSTGYGRAYRALLDGRWGIVDVEDCVAAARFLVSQGLADPARLAIRGGSAGGYTTLCALTFTDAFSAGASYYGVGDLGALARDTHKFESRYLDRLIGPLPGAASLYAERSPLNHVERLSCPVIFLQGLDDRVVPPNQAEEMVGALRAKGLPVAYLTFAGEGHGFRSAEAIEAALECEFAFFCRVFGITPAEPLRALEIENLER